MVPWTHRSQHSKLHLDQYSVSGRPFVRRFALCYRTVVCLSCTVCDIGVLYPNGWMHQDETLHGGRPRPWSHCVRCGPSSPQKGPQPPISAHVYCGQTAGWIKMPLGTEVGLSPCHIVLGGSPAPPKKGAQLPQIFAVYLCGQTAGWIKMPLGRR